LRPRNQSDTGNEQRSEERWRGNSSLSSGNGSGKGSSRQKQTETLKKRRKHPNCCLALKLHTSLLQYRRAVPLWLAVAHLVKLMTWSRCLVRELTSSCCFFKPSSWSLVKAWELMCSLKVKREEGILHKKAFCLQV